MTPLGTLEQKTLKVLEEAGEDHLSALLNTVIPVEGDIEELSFFRTALTKLIGEDLLRLARSRKPGQRTLAALSAAESIAVLSHLNSMLVWSESDRIWKRDETSISAVDVVLTEEGLAAAREILLREGV
jgi:hypothetical protein